MYFNLVELSKIKGFGSAKVSELNKKGILSVEQMLDIPPPQYAEMTGVDNETARSHFTKAKEAMDKEKGIKSKFKSGMDCKSEEDNIEKIKTGSKALDKLFMGGVETSATTEVYGEFGSGKTQFSHTMCVMVQKPIEQGGLDAKAIWINTEGTFEPSRIISIAEANGLDPEKTLNNILVADALNSVDQHNIMMEIINLLVEDKSYKLIVVDSATGLFKQDYSGLGMLSERQKYLDKFLTLCSNVSKVHKVAVIWTNQIYTAPLTFNGDPTVAVGGSAIAHKSTYRVYFTKSGRFRMAKMVDSPKDAQTEVMFGLSKSGVVDMDVAVEEEDARKKKLTSDKTKAKAGNVFGEAPTKEEKTEELEE